MEIDDEKNAGSPKNERPASANDIANVQEDNGQRPLDKTEGRMNNGETGGAGQTEDRPAADEKAQ